MGIDIGFDLVPPLKEEEELRKWDLFIQEIEAKYKKDDILETKEDKSKLVFKVGEYPELVRSGKWFRRFSSKLTSGDNPRKYIDDVADVAIRYFGDRIVFWTQYGEEGETEAPYT